MADVMDVCDALVSAIVGAVYPSGTSQPSVAGVQVTVYPGWPVPAVLDEALKDGKVHVSVYPRPDERNTSRYPKEWQPSQDPVAPAVTLTASGQNITVGGTAPGQRAHNLVVIIDGTPFSYSTTSADTINSIASAIGAIVGGVFSGTAVAGATITIPAPARISAARVGVTGQLLREVRRQERLFQVTVWAPDNDTRNAVAGAIDAELADIQFLTLSDYSAARLIYKGSPVTDSGETALLYRRDLLYTVEYATTQQTTGTQILTEEINIESQNIDDAEISQVTFNF